MKQSTKILIGVLVFLVVFLSIYAFIKSNEAMKQEAFAFAQSELARQAQADAEMQAELAEREAAEARRAEAEAYDMREQLEAALAECNKKK